MARVNENYRKLAGGYLFPEISRRVGEFSKANPEAEIIRLGIGDTTEPLTPSVVKGLLLAAERLGNPEAYKGYGDEQGEKELREKLSQYYVQREVALDSSEIFIGDGAKSDIGNIQSIFDVNNKVAVQDPVYPVYVDTNVIAGRTGNHTGNKYEGIIYMPCTKKNRFFPELPAEKADLIYLCFPNNPTGAVATKEQLKGFVDYALLNKAIIIFDSAYSMFVSESNIPKSIYEIEGAKNCAIEVSSFSKWAGFTGIRLGWTIVPKELVTQDTAPGELNSFWLRRQSTFFNGASIISQGGGIAVLLEQGQKECQGLVNFYMENAAIIKTGIESMGLEAFGGKNAPYVWIKTPDNMSSWDFFDKLLKETHVVGTPGSGFGPSGEGYLRLSAFGSRKNIEKGIEKIKKNLKL